MGRAHPTSNMPTYVEQLRETLCDELACFAHVNQLLHAGSYQLAAKGSKLYSFIAFHCAVGSFRARSGIRKVRCHTRAMPFVFSTSSRNGTYVYPRSTLAMSPGLKWSTVPNFSKSVASTSCSRYFTNKCRGMPESSATCKRNSTSY